MIKDGQIVIPLVDTIEDESYSKEFLLEMFITDLLDYGYSKDCIKEVLEYELEYPTHWYTSDELNNRTKLQ